MKKHRFKSAETYKQLKEVDYLDKLSEDEKKWVEQFYMEYYQADFNYDSTIHPKKLHKDCYSRNNASKRQVHSLGNEKLKEAINRSIVKANSRPGKKSKYYSAMDYNGDLSNEEYPENDQEDQDDNEDLTV